MTINSLNNLYQIDERELLLNCLSSLDNNVFNITGYRVPNLGRDMYQRNLEDVRDVLFKSYIRKIKQNEHDLTDLIINDLYNAYQPQITQTYETFMFGTTYGGGDGPSRPVGRSRPPAVVPLPIFIPPIPTERYPITRDPDLIPGMATLSEMSAMSRKPPIKMLKSLSRRSSVDEAPTGLIGPRGPIEHVRRFARQFHPLVTPINLPTIPRGKISTVSFASRTSDDSLSAQRLIEERTNSLENLPRADLGKKFVAYIDNKDKQELIAKYKNDNKLEWYKIIFISEELEILFESYRTIILTDILSSEDGFPQTLIKVYLDKLVSVIEKNVYDITETHGRNDFNEQIKVYNTLLNKKQIPQWYYNHLVITFIFTILYDYITINPNEYMNQLVDLMLGEIYTFNDAVFSK